MIDNLPGQARQTRGKPCRAFAVSGTQQTVASQDDTFEATGCRLQVAGSRTSYQATDYYHLGTFLTCFLPSISSSVLLASLFPVM